MLKQHFLERVRQIMEQVPAVSNLNGSRRARAATVCGQGTAGRVATSVAVTSSLVWVTCARRNPSVGGSRAVMIVGEVSILQS